MYDTPSTAAVLFLKYATQKRNNTQICVFPTAVNFCVPSFLHSALSRLVYFQLVFVFVGFRTFRRRLHSSIYSCNVCTVTSLIVNGNLFSLDCLFRRPSPCWCILISSPFPLSTQPLPLLIFLTQFRELLPVEL